MLSNEHNDKTIYIIDGYGFIFRAFYAVPNFKTKDGIPVGAVYGFFKMILSLINLAKPEYMVIALDTGNRTFRNDIYDDFLETKALNEIFSNDECKKKFEEIGISFDDIKNMTINELGDKLSIDDEKVFDVCKKYNLDLSFKSKVLIVLIFLGLVDNLKIENCKTQYKSNRKETPDDLKLQFKIITELIDSIGIKIERKIGFEADDVICSISKNATKNGYKSIIVSADKDLCQLVKDGETAVYDPVKKHFLNEKAVIDRFGVRADQIRDYLSIVGDHSDNVFGVNGIGPKGAIKLLEKYGHIENIFLHFNELDDVTKKKFLASKDILELAYELISLRDDAVEIDDFEKFKLNINYNNLNEFIKKYDFKSFDKTHKDKTNTNDNEKKIDKKDTDFKQKYLF